MLIELVPPMFMLSIMFSSADMSQRFRPGRQKALIIGLYQSCQENQNKNSSIKINTKGETCKDSIGRVNQGKDVLEKGLISFGNISQDIGHSLQDIEYQPVTFCSWFEIQPIILGLLLDSENMIPERLNSPDNYWNAQKIYLEHPNYGNIEYSRILAVMVYSDPVISSQMMSLLVTAPFPVYNLVSGWQTPYTLLDNRQESNIRPEIYALDIIYEKINQLLVINQINNFALVDIEADSFPYGNLYHYIKDKTQTIKTKHCFHDLHVNLNFESSLGKVFGRITNTGIRVVITFGFPEKQVEFFNKAMEFGLHHLAWIMLDVDENSSFSDVPFTTKIGTFYNEPNDIFDFLRKNKYYESEEEEFVKETENRKFIKSTHSKWADLDALKEIRSTCERKMILLYRAYVYGLSKEIKKRPNLWYDLFFKRFPLYVKAVYSSMPLYVIEKISGRITRGWGIKFRRDLKYFSSNCTKSECNAGYDVQTSWKDSYFGENCIPCQEGYYKKAKERNCQQCPEFTKPTPQRDSCYDEFTTTYPIIVSKEISIFVYNLNIAGALFSLTALAIFTVKKKTPLVRALDYNMTMLHLMTLLSNFLVTPPLFLGKPTIEICISRPILVSLLNTLSASFYLIKSQRMLLIFKSKTQINTWQAKRNKLLQAIQSCLMVIVGLILIYLTSMKTKPRLEYRRIRTILIKDLYCNTGEHINIQLGYFLIIQIFIAIQAFRSRNLPGPFNESTQIVYSTLIVFATYSVTFPIYAFQDLDSKKSTVHCMVITVANFFPMLLLYGKRLLVVIFAGKKNSKEYIRRRLWTFSSDG